MYSNSLMDESDYLRATSHIQAALEIERSAGEADSLRILAHLMDVVNRMAAELGGSRRVHAKGERRLPHAA